MIGEWSLMAVCLIVSYLCFSDCILICCMLILMLVSQLIVCLLASSVVVDCESHVCCNYDLILTIVFIRCVFECVVCVEGWCLSDYVIISVMCVQSLCECFSCCREVSFELYLDCTRCVCVQRLFGCVCCVLLFAYVQFREVRRDVVQVYAVLCGLLCGSR